MDCKEKGCKPYRYVPYFPGWTEFTATIPKLYWDSYSQEERIHCITALIHKISCYCDMLGDKISDNRKDIDYLLSEFVEFKEHGFDDYYAAQVAQWISDNLERIFSDALRIGVYFGLTLDGYFIAYIPQTWNQIYFDTGADYSSDEYGRLILGYYVDSQPPTEQ